VFIVKKKTGTAFDSLIDGKAVYVLPGSVRLISCGCWRDARVLGDVGSSRAWAPHQGMASSGAPLLSLPLLSARCWPSGVCTVADNHNRGVEFAPASLPNLGEEGAG
jgi:hypothetical protein